MNMFLRSLIVLLPVLILVFFAKILLVDDEIKFKDFESKNFPEFSLNDLNGDPVRAQSLDGIKLVNVWASWCITCLVEHPFLTKLSGQNFKIIGLNYKDDLNNAKKFINEMGNPYSEIIIDNDGTISIELGAYGIPETFIIDKNKIILKKFVGPINDQSLKEIESLLK